jgi:filamentous hemagglutinin family protein
VNASTLLFPLPGRAQITPDNTLNVNSIVTPNGNTLTIEAGSRAGGNLFHSFTEFSLPTGSEAFFNNALDVQNIFSRVTGSNISHIDGLIRANGAANLFLINPNGIIFGPNARLNIGGSFIVSTASSINFADGTSFSATNPAAAPLLTVSVPVGLGFGSNPGDFALSGTGHNLRVDNALIPPTIRSRETTGLQVIPGKTLALVGGEVNLNGGILTAEEGRVEIGSVGASSLVGINSIAAGFALDYSGVQNFRDIALTQRSLADSSGNNAGSIQVQGNRVSIRDGSVILVKNQGTQTAGEINVRADLLEAIGTTLDGRILSGVINETSGIGAGGNITINARQVRVQNAGVISSRTFSSAPSGTVTVNASELVQVSGFAPNLTNRVSTISSIARTSSGNAGEVKISTERLEILNGGVVFAATFGSGAGGNVTINAEAIAIANTTPTFDRSAISASSFGTGNAGNITLNTGTLNIDNGGTVSSSSFATGVAGSITVNASESIQLSGRVAGVGSSSIISAVFPATPNNQRFLGLPAIPSGNSGNVTLNTPVLSVTNGANLGVRNDGIGDAGKLRVNAGSILLDFGGSISASTNSGEGGNITLSVQNSLIARHNSQITATAGGTGNGGNLNINSDVIIALENSDISANAVQGRGGNIQISTQGIFGTEFRPQQTPESDITASSQFGLSGNVVISNPEVETKSFLVELSQNLLDTSEQITTGCAADRGNTFSITGRGGLPENPSSGLLGRAVWWDNRDLSQVSQTAQKLPKTETTPEIVEATGFRINAQGQVELVADAASSSNSWQSPTNCQTLPLSSSGLRNP